LTTSDVVIPFYALLFICIPGLYGDLAVCNFDIKLLDFIANAYVYY